MENKNTKDTSPSTIWARRSTSNKLNLSTNKSEGHDASSAKRYGSLSSHGKKDPFGPVGSIGTAVASPTSAGASSAFGLGGGAFAFGVGGAKTPKAQGASLDLSRTQENRESSDENTKENTKDTKRPPPPPPNKSQSAIRAPNSATESPQVSAKEVGGGHPLKYSWVIYYRPPTSKGSDYEKSIRPLCRINTVESFWSVYAHLRRPSDLSTVSDYHLFREGIRPVWEDEENNKGGKWTMRLKKGVADRYWEDLLLAVIGDQFAEASDEVCGLVVSVRSGEDVFSVWTKHDGGKNIKIRETIKRVLSLPPETKLWWQSHNDTIEQSSAVQQARQEKANLNQRRNTLVEKKEDGESTSKAV